MEVIKSPKYIIKGDKHTFNTQQQSGIRDQLRPQKDFSEILKREARPSILDKESNPNNYADNFESLTFENKAELFDHASE